MLQSTWIMIVQESQKLCKSLADLSRLVWRVVISGDSNLESREKSIFHTRARSVTFRLRYNNLFKSYSVAPFNLAYLQERVRNGLTLRDMLCKILQSEVTSDTDAHHNFVLFNPQPSLRNMA
jgi:hypothetical protein